MMYVPIIDLHCHPALKFYLSDRRSFVNDDKPPIDFSPFKLSTLHADIPSLKGGHVRGLLCSHYVPEHGFVSSMKAATLLRIASKISPLRPDFFESPDRLDDAWYKFNDSYWRMSDQILRAQREGHADIVEARTYEQFRAAWDRGDTVIVHAMEGAHHIGRRFNIYGEENPALCTIDDYRARINAFKHSYGVGLVTIGHFFDNDIAATAGGIQRSTSRMLGYGRINGFDGLTDTGEQVIKHMLEVGIIVDVMHCSKIARRQIYEIARDVNNDRAARGLSKRPVIMSHIGLRSMYEKGRHADPEQIECLADDHDVAEITATGGVIGVIMMQVWLTGTEERMFSRSDSSIAAVCDAVMAINKVADNDFESVAIGTDFDGLSEVPDDLPDPSYMPRLVEALHERLKQLLGSESRADDAIRKICHGNALRVIERGWS
jgi:microsomal dipeptidase-like Zn-dependent dipeptidase